MKKALMILLVIILSTVSFVCGTKLSDKESENQVVFSSIDDEYSCNAKVDSYPDVIIYAKTRESLDEVLDVLLDIGIDLNEGNTSKPETTTKYIEKSTSLNSESSRELNSYEKEIYDLLVASIKKFPNPSSVRVIEIHAYQSENKKYYLTLTYENNLGGHTTDLLELDSEGAYGSYYTESDLDKMGLALGLTYPKCSAAKINEYLNEYYHNQGWN